MTLPTPIPVHHERYEMYPYYIANFLPRAMPAAAAFGKSTANVGTADISDALAAQLSIDLGATSRWIANPATLTDHGDGTFRWTPSQGTLLSSYWSFVAANAPVADPTYSWKLKDGTEVDIPAFLFRGNIWGRLAGFPDDPPGYTAICVARIRGTNGGAYADLFASVVSGADPDHATDAAVQLRGDYIRSIAKGRSVYDRIIDTHRPHLIASQQGHLASFQVVGDDDFSWKVFNHDPVTAYDMTWWLARPSDTYVAELTLVMDCLDIAIWDHAMSFAHVREAINKLNGIYGITG